MSRVASIQLQFTSDLTEARARFEAQVKEWESRQIKLNFTGPDGQKATTDNVATLGNPGGVAAGGSSAAAKLDQVASARVLAQANVTAESQLSSRDQVSLGGGPPASGSNWRGKPRFSSDEMTSTELPPSPTASLATSAVASLSAPTGQAAAAAVAQAVQQTQAAGALTWPAGTQAWGSPIANLPQPSLAQQAGGAPTQPTPTAPTAPASPSPSPRSQQPYGGRYGAFRVAAVGLVVAREAAQVAQEQIDYNALLAGDAVLAGNNPIAQAQSRVRQLEASQQLARTKTEAAAAVPLATIGAILGSAFGPVGTAVGAGVGLGAGKIAGGLGYSGFNAKSDAIARANAERNAVAVSLGEQDRSAEFNARVASLGVGITGFGADIIGDRQQREQLDREYSLRERDNPESLTSLRRTQDAQRSLLGLKGDDLDRRMNVERIGLQSGSVAAERQALQDQIDSLQESDLNARTSAGTFPTQDQSTRTESAVALLRSKQQELDRRQSSGFSSSWSDIAADQATATRNFVGAIDYRYDAAVAKARGSFSPNSPEYRNALGLANAQRGLEQFKLERDNTEQTYDLRNESRALRFGLSDQPLDASVQRITGQRDKELRELPSTGFSFLDDALGFSQRREAIQDNSALQERVAKQQFGQQVRMTDINLGYESYALDRSLARDPMGARAAGIAGSTISRGNQLAYSGMGKEAEFARGIGIKELELEKQNYLDAFRGREIDFRSTGVTNPRDVTDPAAVMDEIAKQEKNIHDAKFGSNGEDAPDSPAMKEVRDLLKPLMGYIEKLTTGQQ